MAVDRLRDVEQTYVTEQCTVIMEAEPALRQREPIVHTTRVAVRRLRSTLRVFADTFEAEPAGALEQELVWYAGLLGAVRDLDILSARLSGQLAELPRELVLGPIARQLETELQVRHQAGWQALLAAFDEPRYAALIDDLKRWSVDPPFTSAADAEPEAAIGYVKRAGKKLRKRLGRALDAWRAGDDEADELLHSARKAGKRHRYAAELSMGVWAKSAQVVEDRKALQDVLGEHQDSQVSATFLREEGVRMGNRSGHNGFTYGLLYARELARRDAIGDQLARFVG